MIYDLLIVAVMTIVASVVAWWTMTRFIRLLKPHSVLRDLIQASIAPLQFLIWGYGILHIMGVLSEHFDLYVNQHFLAMLRRVFFVIMAGWYLIRSKESIERLIFKKLSQKSLVKEDEMLFLTFSRVLTIIIFSIVGLIFLDTIGVPISAMLAFGGVGGLAISLAAKDMIANFFGGLMIQVNRPFSVGEWIRSPNKNFEGFVEYIGWYTTQLRTFERRPMYIPNAMMTDAIIENPGRMYNRRIRTQIGLRYSDINSVKPVTREIEAMLKSHPHVDKNQIINVRFVGFGSHSLDIDIYCFCTRTKLVEFRDAQEEIYLKIAEIIQSHGAEIAFPTTTILVDK